MIKGKVMGIISLYTSEIREFRKEEIEFLSILATQAAVAIENAQLFQKLRDYVQIFLKLAGGISSSLDIKTILQTLTEDIAKNLDVKASIGKIVG